MAQDASSATAGDMTNALSDFEVAQAQTDGASDQKETAWGNENWPQWLGYFNKVPEFNTIVTK